MPYFLELKQQNDGNKTSDKQMVLCFMEIFHVPVQPDMIVSHVYSERV